MPYKNFEQSAKCLDRQRLGRQRLEAKLLLEILLEEIDRHTIARWKNHPVIELWRGSELSLCNYGIKICTEWKKRGYQDNQLEWFWYYQEMYKFRDNNQPNFSEELHASHRAALLCKLPGWYQQFGWKEKPQIKYVWH